jgi:prepilin-type processing-associated H-X9-DG protein
VTLWEGTRQLGELPPADEQVLDLRYDGDTLLAAPMRASGDGWEPLPPLFRALHPWRAVAATWDARGRLLVASSAPAGGHEQQVRLYDGLTREGDGVLWADDEWQRVEVVAAGAGRIAAAALEVRAWDAATLEQRVVIAERGKQVRRLALVGEQVIVAYADGHVAVHGRAGWEAHADEASGLAVRPSGQQLATGGWDGRVALWSIDGETLGEADLGVEVADVAFLGEDRLLALHQLPETGVTMLSLGG